MRRPEPTKIVDRCLLDAEASPREAGTVVAVEITVPFVSGLQDFGAQG